MAVTYIDHAGTQGQTDFSFNFTYLEDEHITVEIDGVETTDFTVVTTPTSKVVLDTGLSAAASVRVIRRSAPNENLVDFQNGSVLTESELDRAYLHNRYLAEESAEQNDVSMRLTAGAAGFDALNKKIFNVVDPTTDQDAATKNYVDETVAGVALGTVPDGSITAAKLEDGSVTTTKLADGNVTAAKISTTDANFNVQSNGYVGIGTANPGYELEVVGWIAVKAGALSTDSVINLAASNSTNYSAKVRIKATSESEANESSSLTFSTTDSSDVVAERVRIDSNGYVGIGNINPTHALDVSGDVNVSLGNTFKINGANFLLDQDNMSDNSNTQGATQQSIKAYVDSQVLSKYTAAWATSHGGVTVADLATLTITHNLGTTDVQASLYVNSSASDTGAVAPFAEGDAEYGWQVTGLTSNTITVQLGTNGYHAMNTSGVGVITSYASKFIKVVVIG